MANGYDAPVELREIEKMLTGFTYSNGLDITRVFDDWLRYIMSYFALDPKPVKDWPYTKEQNVVFHKMMCEWILVMNRQIDKHEWYDAFGDLYMSCIASDSRQSGAGQFFTPAEVCDLMTMVSNGPNPEKVVGKNISDPTCGSGRTLLSFHVRNIGNYLCAEDLDRTCCMMTVCNFIIHGCVGEVVWHDSLNPETYFGGWAVNPILSRSGIPGVLDMPKENSKIWCHWQAEKQARLQVKAEPIPAIARPASLPTQLSLF